MPSEPDPSDDIILTTTPQVPGYRLVRVFSIVAADVVFSFANPAQRNMATSTHAALAYLRREAHKLGADAVVGVDIDYVETVNAGGLTVIIIASGTAVGLDAE